jgi:formylglycine-generating enzyme required for sulfatase activity
MKRFIIGSCLVLFLASLCFPAVCLAQDSRLPIKFVLPKTRGLRPFEVLDVLTSKESQYVFLISQWNLPLALDPAYRLNVSDLNITVHFPNGAKITHMTIMKSLEEDTVELGGNFLLLAAGEVVSKIPFAQLALGTGGILGKFFTNQANKPLQDPKRPNAFRVYGLQGIILNGQRMYILAYFSKTELRRSLLVTGSFSQQLRRNLTYQGTKPDRWLDKPREKVNINYKINLENLESQFKTDLPKVRKTTPPLAIAPFDVTRAKDLQRRAAEYYGVPIEYTNSIGMKLVYIPSGEFMMGSHNSASEVARITNYNKNNVSEDTYVHEHPLHRVRINKGFWMSIYEVTQGQYRTAMGRNPSYFNGDNNPVERVNWYDAVVFCMKLSDKEGRTYRLPTEAEWEYACRAGTTTPFYFGETISTDQANYVGYYPYGSGRKGVYRKRTVPVGSFPPNAFGLYDMHGNVSEWCLDWYAKDYYSNSPSNDPLGPSSSEFHVMRGGFWACTALGCRAANRTFFSDTLSNSTGFRVVCLDFQ